VSLLKPQTYVAVLGTEVVGGTTPRGLVGKRMMHLITHACAGPATLKTQPYWIDVAANRVARAADACSNVGSGKQWVSLS